MFKEKHSGKVVLLPIFIIIIICLIFTIIFIVSNNINDGSYGKENIKEKVTITSDSADVLLNVNKLNYDEYINDVFIQVDYNIKRNNSTAWNIDYTGSLKYDKIKSPNTIIFKFHNVKNENNFHFKNLGDRTSITNARVIYVDSTDSELIYVK